MTSSVMTRRSRRFASVMNLRKSRMRAEVGIDAAIVGDVVAVVLAGARIERQQPQRVDAEVLQIIELLGQAGEVADAVAVAVGERLDVKLIDDRVLVPEVVLRPWAGRRFAAARSRHDPFQISQRNSRAGSSDGLMVSRTPPHSIVCRSPVTRLTIGAHRRAHVARADGDLAEVEPERARAVAVERDGDGDRVVMLDRFLDEADHLAVVDLREAQVAGLLQRRVLASDAVERPI